MCTRRSGGKDTDFAFAMMTFDGNGNGADLSLAAEPLKTPAPELCAGCAALGTAAPGPERKTRSLDRDLERPRLP